MIGRGTPCATRAVVVVNFASHALLEANIAGQKFGSDVQVVVVDNYSGVSERVAVHQLAQAEHWVDVLMPDNRGFGAAVNAGVRRAVELGCETVLLLNPDAKIETEDLRRLFQHCEDHPEELVAPIIQDSTGRVVFRGSELSLKSGAMRGLRSIEPTSPGSMASQVLKGSAPGWVPWLTGACLAIHRTSFEYLGGFDEGYFLYWEDVDFSAKAHSAGFRLVVRSDLRAHHDEGGSQRKGGGPSKSKTYYFYNCRNRLIYAQRHLAWREALAWSLRSPGQSWQILIRGGRRQVLTSPVTAISAVAGTLAGLGHLAFQPLRSGQRDKVTVPNRRAPATLKDHSD